MKKKNFFNASDRIKYDRPTGYLPFWQHGMMLFILFLIIFKMYWPTTFWKALRFLNTKVIAVTPIKIRENILPK